MFKRRIKKKYRKYHAYKTVDTKITWNTDDIDSKKRILSIYSLNENQTLISVRLNILMKVLTIFNRLCGLFGVGTSNSYRNTDYEKEYHQPSILVNNFDLFVVISLKLVMNYKIVSEQY